MPADRQLDNGVDDAPLIELNDVVKIYKTAGGGVTALNQIKAKFYPGEFIGILGKSGAGKSTLINMITAVDHITSGEVFIKGASIHQLKQNQAARLRSQYMGIVYQNFRLMPSLSLLDNIMLPMDLGGTYHRRESLERAKALLDEVQLLDHGSKHPSATSGGQQQRVAIARALANAPPIIIGDEPTGRLDSGTTEVIFEMFEKLVQQGKLVIIATHDTSMSDRFSRRVMIEDGVIVEDTGISV